ncbi:MAG: methyltransferase domain-containing protein [Thermomicrobiales bacterium]
MPEPPDDDPHAVVARGYDIIAERYAAWTGEALTGARAWAVASLEGHVPPGAAVLDLGCGAGVPVSRALTARYAVTGLDASARNVALARRNVPGATFLHADMAQAVFPAGAFAAIIACYAIIHVPRAEHAALLRRIAGWLQPGGLLIATMGAEAAENIDPDWLGAPMYWSHFDAATNARLVEEAGLQVLEARIDTADEDGQPVAHQWIVARKPA